MPDIPLTGHTLFDALWNLEHRIQKRAPTLEPDGSITTDPILTDVPEARSCSGPTNCIFRHIVLAGGSPCNKCRYLVKGNYFISEKQRVEESL